MNYSVFTIPPFDRQLKRLVKKYASLKKEFGSLLQSLEENPAQGTALGNNCFKIRLPIAAKGKGKSGGARVITSVVVTDTTVYLVAVKSPKNENLNFLFPSLTGILFISL